MTNALACRLYDHSITLKASSPGPQIALSRSAPIGAVSREMADTFSELAEVRLEDKWGVGEEGLFFEILHGRIDNEGS